MVNLKDRLVHAFNAFSEKEQASFLRPYSPGASYGYKPDRMRLNITNERSIISSIYTTIGIDAAAISIRHTRMDLSNNRYLSDMDSGLNSCLTLEANIDQAGRAFRQDLVMSILDKGVIAIVPVDTSLNPDDTGSYDIRSLRIGEITQWYPKYIKCLVYNDNTGRKEEIYIAKKNAAIVENPLYAVMNEPNSTLQRLVRKLNLLDTVDEASSSGKLDLIIQLPYVVKTDQRREQANRRREDIEVQLKGSKYGVAYTDGTEKITQLNRPAENNLLKQVEYLTDMLYGQLGITEAVMNGTADEKTMINYYNRTIDPLLAAISEAMKRTFITKTGRTQGQSIEYYRDPFKLIGISDIAELADKLTRNEIASSNEIRQVIGFKPNKDPKADELRNKNLPIPEDSLENQPT